MRDWADLEQSFCARINPDFIPPCAIMQQLGSEAASKWTSEVVFTLNGPVRRICPKKHEQRPLNERLSFSQFRVNCMDHMVRFNWTLDQTYDWILNNCSEVGLSMLQMAR